MEATIYEFSQEENNVENIVEEVEGVIEKVREGESQSNSNNEFVKGVIIGASAAGTVGAAGWALWLKQRKENKVIFEEVEKTNFIARDMYAGKMLTKYKKEEIDNTKRDMEDPKDMIIDLKARIENAKFVSKKTKEKWIDSLTELITLSAKYRELQFLKQHETEMESTETLDEK